MMLFALSQPTGFRPLPTLVSSPVSVTAEAKLTLFA